jgi:hypothetical protein
MLTLIVSVNFFPREKQSSFPQTFPVSTLKTLGAGDDLPYSATASRWEKSRHVSLSQIHFLFFPFQKMPPSKKDGNTNAVAAFHHVVAKGDLEKVKDFVLVLSPVSCPPSILPPH